MSRKSTKSATVRAQKGPGFKARAMGIPDHRKKVNSKVKGNANELEVAKALSKWTGVEFRRTPASGAIHVPLDWLAGDVFCTDKSFDFPFSVETKHYSKIYPKMKKDFWLQACNDAARISKIPMLMYRENGWPAKTWKVQFPSVGLYPYALYNIFEMLPLNGTRPSMRVNSTDLFEVDYNELIKIFK